MHSSGSHSSRARLDDYRGAWKRERRSQERKGGGGIDETHDEQRVHLIAGASISHDKIKEKYYIE